LLPLPLQYSVRWLLEARHRSEAEIIAACELLIDLIGKKNK
jgi:hypothetical protein